ncbi:AAA family ATPase [Methylobacterium sp. SI9]|uniref:AAA family ATPase n=1 Tax=Methylobacterium guangdongense TaxID=3138811 RepID=UPI00313A8C3C
MKTAFHTTKRSPGFSAIEEPSHAAARILALQFLATLEKIERGTDASFVDCGGRPPHDDESQIDEPAADRRPDVRAAWTSVPADLAVVAVLVARAFKAREGLLQALRCGSPVVVIATHAARLVEPVRRIVKHCIVGHDIGSTNLKSEGMRLLKAGRTGILVRDGLQDTDRPDYGNDLIAQALPIRVPLIGIAPDPMRHLPRDMVRAAEHRLALPALDRSMVEVVIEGLFGERATCRLNDELLRTLDIADFPVALRNVSTAVDAMEAIARTLVRKQAPLDASPSLENLHGYGEAKIWGAALIGDLEQYRSGQIRWNEIDNRGLLLSGPPGTGKTLFANALAKSSRVPLITTSVADWNSERHLSGTLRAIRDVFERAREAAPCILFIDELDGISSRACVSGEYREYWTQIVNCLLEQLGCHDDRTGVIVVGATNFPDRIDPAVRRAGRLDREIAIRLPDVIALVEIFRHHLHPHPPPDVSLMTLALAARGRTGADVEAFVRRARGLSRRAGRELTIEDVLNEIRQGRPVLSAMAKRRVAIHEAGHAVVGRALGVGSIVDISIHDAGGELILEPAFDGTSTLSTMEACLAALMAGRVAEEIVLGDVSIGVGLGSTSDLAKATRIAGDIELKFGLGVLGPIHVEMSSKDVLFLPGILEAVSARLGEAEKTARSTIEMYRRDLTLIADALQESGYLSGSEIEELLRSPDVDPSAMIGAVPIQT